MKRHWLLLGVPVADAAAQKEYAALWGPIAQRDDAMRSTEIHFYQHELPVVGGA
ncbi:MAG: hypothetical protein U1E59_01985 [Amaricoccus sp.]